MVHLFKQAISRWRTRRALKQALSPAAFRHLAAEMISLATAATQVETGDAQLQETVTRILNEMQELQKLAGERKFSRLSREKRLMLKKQLLVSRKNLLDRLQAAAPPTDRIQ
jgi:hypothetical protein